MSSEPGDQKKRKAYEPPQLIAISLRPEEAVLGHCKNSSAAGPGLGACANIPTCFNNGS